jgi:hypothetical protein
MMRARLPPAISTSLGRMRIFSSSGSSAPPMTSSRPARAGTWWRSMRVCPSLRRPLPPPCAIPPLA